MALKTVDLTQQPHRVIFTGCSQEEVNYAKTFWQSLQLLPPMESRLVSSDIKQRLRKAPPSRSMSECKVKSTESSSHGLSFSLTLSNSSCGVADNCTKLTLHLHPARTDSLKTHTSCIPDFGDAFDEIETEGSSSSQGRERNYEEPSHGKFSVIAAGRGLGTIQEAESKPCILGAGGREFWSWWSDRKEESWENGLTRTIQPFSGEDLCRRKGFLNWGEQNVLSKMAGNSTHVEFGGEELRGKPSLQYPAIVLSNNGVSGGNIQKNSDGSMQKLNDNNVQKSSLQKFNNGNKQKLSGGQHSAIGKTPHQEAPFSKSSLHQNKKRQQRVVGKRQEVTSLCQSRNIPPEKFNLPIKSSSLLTNLLQPVLNVLPETFTKQFVSRGRDDIMVNKTKKQEKESNSKTKAIGQKSVSHSHSEQIISRGKTKNLKNQWKLVKAVTKPEDRSKESTTTQGNNPAQIPSGDEHKVGIPHLANPPPVLLKPSKDLVYWTAP